MQLLAYVPPYYKITTTLTAKLILSEAKALLITTLRTSIL